MEHSRMGAICGRVIISLSVLLLTGCFGNSTIVRNEGVGSNGSFEFGKEGKPINWYVYHKALKKGQAELTYDQAEVKDGKRSLKFIVTSCSGKGGWESPGIYQEIAVQPGTNYRVSFWLKNVESSFNVSVNGVAGKIPQQAIRVLTEAGLGEEWSEYSVACTTLPNESAIRFELNITGPGTLWLDNVDIQEVEGS